MKIKGKLKGELEIKRFYLEGLEISEKCPKCGKEIFINDYLSYPKMNDVEKIWFYCDDCDFEFGKRIRLNISIEEFDSEILEGED